MKKKHRVVTGNSGLMRSINRNLIIQAMLEHENISRTELVSLVGLALPTVMRIVDSLIEEELVVEVGKGNSSGGRKPMMLRINSDAMYFIGVSIQRVLRVALADACGVIRSRCETLTRTEDDSDTILQQILDCINQVIAMSGVNTNKIALIGVGTPGTLFSHGEELANCPFKIWADFDFTTWKHRFPFPVEFDNIAKAGALSELMFGCGREAKNFVYVFADYGIGAGIVQNGKLYRGRDTVAGEFGHTGVDMNGQACYCGNRGCLEMYCATPAILRSVQQKFPDNAVHDFSQIVEAYRRNETAAISAIRASGETLGLGLANLVNLLNPNMIVLGGELPDACDGYVETAAQSARRRIFSRAAQDTPIVRSTLGEEGILRGTVALAMNQVFEHPLIL